MNPDDSALTADVVIIGGGVIGAAAALFLTRHAGAPAVTVIEADPGYSRAATPVASGGVRQLFSCPENTQMSQYTLELISTWAEFLGLAAEDVPDLAWREQGYLFIGGGEGAGDLSANFDRQLSLGVRARWLTTAELAERYPLMRVDDLAGGVLSPHDGWLDPHSLHTGLRLASIHQGTTWLTDRVVGFGEVSRALVHELQLASGARITADVIVNAAGCWAPGLAQELGMKLPVEPMRRYEHYVESALKADDLPFLKDPAGLAVRPEAGGFSVGLVNWGQPSGFDLRIDPHYFPDYVWPALAHRFPDFDRLHLRSTWAGLYDQNRFDGNMICGNWPGHLDNFYVACGFSGHGLMHAPAIGRALSELILDRGYVTLDLSRLGYRRIVDGTPYPERGIR